MTQRRPDTYTSINTNTQRTSLPSQSHKIVFLTSDTLGTNAPATEVPVAVYDSAGADKAMGTAENKTSIASRMVDAALKVSQGVDMSVANKAGGANNILCVPTSISVRNADCEVGKTYVLSLSVNNSAYKEFNVTASEGDTILKIFTNILRDRHILENHWAEGWYCLEPSFDSIEPNADAKQASFSGHPSLIEEKSEKDLHGQKNAHNIVRIVRTKELNTEQENDMYEYIISAPQDGVEIHSCSIKYAEGV